MTAIDPITLADARARRSGQGLVEYALIMLLIALATIMGLGVLGSQVTTLYSRIVASFV